MPAKAEEPMMEAGTDAVEVTQAGVVRQIALALAKADGLNQGNKYAENSYLAGVGGSIEYWNSLASAAIQSLSTKAEELAACLEKARELLKAMYENEPKEPYELVFDDCMIAQEIDAALEKWRQR